MMEPKYKHLKDLILKYGDNIKGIHKNLYSQSLNSSDEKDQMEYLEMVISQAKDSRSTAVSIWGEEVVDFIYNELNENYNNMKLKKILTDLLREANQKPSAGLSKRQKSDVVKKAKKGADIGKKGKGFDKVAKAAGGGEKGKKIAAAQMWKTIKRKK